MSISWSGSMPEAYERLLVPMLFRPYALDLARRIRARRPRRVLELAAGTGVVTRELTDEEIEVVATDLSEAMIETGRINAPHARWQPADAQALPFDDREFDVVACQFGVMFFPDKRRAFGEARRVLTPGGALVCNAWGATGENAFAAAVVSGLERALGGDAPPFLDVPYGYHDLGMIEADVRAAGFERVSIETMVVDGHAPSALDVAIGYIEGTPLSAALTERGVLDDVRATVEAEVAERFGAGPVTGTLTAHIVEAS
jgi:SAM-dependent methyltransferase